MKSFYEEALALVSLALFLGTIYVWTVIIDDHARRSHRQEPRQDINWLLSR